MIIIDIFFLVLHFQFQSFYTRAIIFIVQFHCFSFGSAFKCLDIALVIQLATSQLVINSSLKFFWIWNISFTFKAILGWSFSMMHLIYFLVVNFFYRTGSIKQEYLIFAVSKLYNIRHFLCDNNIIELVSVPLAFHCADLNSCDYNRYILSSFILLVLVFLYLCHDFHCTVSLFQFWQCYF